MTVPIAVVTFDFDPLLRLSQDLAVRWQTVALTVLVLVVLVGLGLRARATGLRADDTLAIAVGTVPGAMLGGRLAYAAAWPQAFQADPLRLLDPSTGGLELAGAVAGGLLTGAYAASLLDAPVARWARLAAVPVLILLGGGKVAMVLGGSGQGLPSDAPWATAYAFTGPWGSLAPDLPSHPAQLYEGLATLVFAAAIVALVSARAAIAQAPAPEGSARAGGLLLLAIAGWALIRAGVSLTWRDPAVIGPLPMGGAIAILLALACLVAVGLLAVSGRRRKPDSGRRELPPEPAWPDPATRPRF